MNINDKVRVIGGCNEVGQPSMVDKIGIITSFGSQYTVNKIPTKEVYVTFKHFGTHIFNDYHLLNIIE